MAAKPWETNKTRGMTDNISEILSTPSALPSTTPAASRQTFTSSTQPQVMTPDSSSSSLLAAGQSAAGTGAGTMSDSLTTPSTTTSTTAGQATTTPTTTTTTGYGNTYGSSYGNSYGSSYGGMGYGGYGSSMYGGGYGGYGGGMYGGGMYGRYGGMNGEYENAGTFQRVVMGLENFNHMVFTVLDLVRMIEHNTQALGNLFHSVVNLARKAIELFTKALAFARGYLFDEIKSKTNATLRFLTRMAGGKTNDGTPGNTSSVGKSMIFTATALGLSLFLMKYVFSFLKAKVMVHNQSLQDFYI